MSAKGAKFVATATETLAGAGSRLTFASVVANGIGTVGGVAVVAVSEALSTSSGWLKNAANDAPSREAVARAFANDFIVPVPVIIPIPLPAIYDDPAAVAR